MTDRKKRARQDWGPAITFKACPPAWPSSQNSHQFGTKHSTVEHNNMADRFLVLRNLHTSCTREL
jgi:hypothetical protein